MRLIFIINAFNEAKYIKKCIESIHEVADEIWLYDGAYKNYPHNNPQSTDGTLEIAKQFPKVVIHTKAEAWDDQMQKRTAMFENGKDGDYFFKLDGDEYITNPEIIRDYLEGLDVGWVWTISNLYPKPIMTARIFKWQPGLHYAGRHHWLYNGNKKFVTSDQYMNPLFRNKQTSIRLINFRDSSSTKRINDKRTFLANRNPGEQSFSREDKVYPDKYTRLISHPHRAGDPRKRTRVLREVDNVKYTFSVMLSRQWAVEPYLKRLSELELPKSIEAVVLIDSKNATIERRFIEYFNQDKRFDSVRIHRTGNDKLPEYAKAHHRRQRIVDNWHIILTEMRGEILLASEDDSLPQVDAYPRLLEIMEKEKADFVQGNIIGRWQAKICPAWQVVEKDNKPFLVYNAKEQSSGLTEVQGCGWYCFVTPADVARKYAMYVDDLTPLGPDLSFGYNLYRGGYKLLHAWDVKVEHFGEHFSLLPGRDKTEQRMWIKKGEDAKWTSKTFNRSLIENAKKGKL